MTGASLAFYGIITICNAQNLSECRPLLGFSDNKPGYTIEVCERAMADVVDEWLKANAPKWFISEVRCGIHEERGA